MGSLKNKYEGSRHVNSAVNSYMAVWNAVGHDSPHMRQADNNIDRAMKRAHPHAYGKSKPYSSITPEDHAGVVLGLNKTADHLTKAIHEHPNVDEHPVLHGHVSNIRLMAAQYHKAHVGGTHADRIKTQLNEL